MFRKLRRKLVRLAVVSGAGAAANYFFDKDRGPERRTQAKEKAASLVGRQASATDWQSSAANGFEPQAATPPAPAPAPAAAPTTAPTSAPVDVLQTPSASVMDILDGSGGDSVVEPAPNDLPRTGPISAP